MHGFLDNIEVVNHQVDQMLVADIYNGDGEHKKSYMTFNPIQIICVNIVSSTDVNHIN